VNRNDFNFYLSGISESDLAGLLDCNPSLVTETTRPEVSKELNLEIKGNDERPKSFIDDVVKENADDTKVEPEELLVNGTGEPLSDLDFISSQSSQYVVCYAIFLPPVSIFSVTLTVLISSLQLVYVHNLLNIYPIICILCFVLYDLISVFLTNYTRAAK